MAAALFEPSAPPQKMAALTGDAELLELAIPLQGLPATKAGEVAAEYLSARAGTAPAPNSRTAIAIVLRTLTDIPPTNRAHDRSSQPRLC